LIRQGNIRSIRKTWMIMIELQTPATKLCN